MHPFIHAAERPDHIAYQVVPSGEAITYRQLNERSNQAAHLFRSLGLRRGDVVAMLMENNSTYMTLTWAADRSGLYYSCLSTSLTAEELAFILRDSGARVLLTSTRYKALAEQVALHTSVQIRFLVDGESEGFRNYQQECRSLPITAIADESRGGPLLYSSGTTGRPKGIESQLPQGPINTPDTLTTLGLSNFDFNPDMVYLSPAPMYHAAPLLWSMAVQRVGGTVIIMEKFDAEAALQLIEAHQVTHSQWVPTHFVRMLKLDPAVREKYNIDSMKVAFHAAAPCPVTIKQAMMQWWGSVIYEYYGGTEVFGLTAIRPEEWALRPGSVGRPIFGTPHICDDDGNELPPKTEGLIYFEGGNKFVYRNNPESTAAAYNQFGWSTIGDIGWLDEDGYLYLTDRKSYMIVSGGVNIAPQQIEDVIITHPDVFDVAVIGTPDEDFGEKVIAIVQPVAGTQPDDALIQTIQALVRSRLGGVKTPKEVHFMDELPRHPTGKLHKRVLYDVFKSS